MPKRLIDANAFLKDVLPGCKYPDSLREAVERQPKIAAEPVKHGRWIDKPDEYCETNIIRHCSECGWSVFKGNPLYDFGHWNYCPNCGARMDGKPESEVQDDE